MAIKYHVDLTPADRAQLEEVVTTGSASARSITHARILLKADRGPDGPHWSDDQICIDVIGGSCRRQVEQVRPGLQRTAVELLDEQFAVTAVDGGCDIAVRLRSSRQECKR